MCECTDENEMSIWEKIFYTGVIVLALFAALGAHLRYKAQIECYSRGYGEAILYNGESYCVGVRDGNTVLVRVDN